jgi:hypothetical protein
MNYTVISKRRLMRVTPQTVLIAPQMPRPTSNTRDSSICWGGQMVRIPEGTDFKEGGGSA